MGYEYQNPDVRIYDAVIHDKWSIVSKVFEDQPGLRTKQITSRLETPLMLAVGTNQSHYFVEKLLSSLSNDPDLFSREMAAKNINGDTALHYACKIGNTIDAKLMLLYCSNPAEIAFQENNKGKTPLSYAAECGRKKEMLEYLYSLTGVFLSPFKSGIPIQRLYLAPLLTNAIEAGFVDIALKLVEAHSKGVLTGNLYDSQKSLGVLASKPELFQTGARLRFWPHLIYKYFLPVDVEENSSEVKIPDDEKTTSQQYAYDLEAVYAAKEFSYHNYKYKSITTWFKRIFLCLASTIFKNIYDLKLTHKQSQQLLNRICKLVIEKKDHEAVLTILSSTINTAVECANFEVVKECLLAHPSIIWSGNWSQLEQLHVLHQAIKQRQEQVYNLVYQMNSYKPLVLNDDDNRHKVLVKYDDDETDGNVLHFAAKLAPSYRLNAITGAALQMQRELQWFEEIESFVEPSLKGEKNKAGKTPRMLFTEEHKELLKEGKEWMKDTASSSTVVATLIVTMAFAAIFTLPGGEENQRKTAFTLFIISDATALFSSATSALLFLGILTSRYAETDFLHVLPRRLMGGLFTLFLSLAATMITFSATLALVLEDQLNWIAAPLVIITSIPVCLFALIQFPLLIELFSVTYGSTIFRKWYKRVVL